MRGSRPESFDFTGLAESEPAHCAAAAATYGIRVRFDIPKESVFIYAAWGPGAAILPRSVCLMLYLIGMFFLDLF